MKLRAEHIASEVSDLASLPDVCMRLNEMVDDPTVSVLALEEVIAQDPALTARLLKVANSSIFGQRGGVDSLSRAVMLIGTNAVRDIVLATSSIQVFARLSSDLVDMHTFWKHSLYNAIVARTLAAKRRILNKERLFLMGLLHDIGQLAMFHTIPDKMSAIFKYAKQQDMSVAEVEKRALGFDHGEVGCQLLKRWNLPEGVATTTCYHHWPWRAEAYMLETAIIHLADYIANIAGHSEGKHVSTSTVDSQVWHATGFSESVIDSVITISDEHFQEAKALLLEPLDIQAA